MRTLDIACGSFIKVGAYHPSDGAAVLGDFVGWLLERGWSVCDPLVGETELPMVQVPEARYLQVAGAIPGVARVRGSLDRGGEGLYPPDPGHVELVLPGWYFEAFERSRHMVRRARIQGAWMVDVLMHVASSGHFAYGGISFEEWLPWPDRLREGIAEGGFDVWVFDELCVSRAFYGDDVVSSLASIYARGYVEVSERIARFSRSADFNPLRKDFQLSGADRLQIAKLLLSPFDYPSAAFSS